MPRLFLALACALLIVRLPSLAQPMGADQGLYAYVGERVLHGDLAYRDAWDQKPPGIHYAYAALRAVWRGDAIVPAADLLAAAAAAWLLWRIGSTLALPAAGAWAALLFLFLSDPDFSRLAGVRVRAQCETFIAVLVAGAVLLASRAGERDRRSLIGSGVLLGGAFALKYNAAIYVAVLLAAIALRRRLRWTDAAWIALGAAAIPVVLLARFAAGGALDDLYQATFVYNLRYSGETYASRWHMLAYLVTFPIQHARVDALWLLGGLGCAALLTIGALEKWNFRRKAEALPVVWVAAACVSIAINGSRGLPQYFVQAAPALALAAGAAGAMTLPHLSRTWRITTIALLAIAVWRVNDFTKFGSNLAYDTRYVAGGIDRRTYLARYGGQRDADKFSALATWDLGEYLRARTSASETVLVFGFSPGASVYAERRSATRFFWSRPVILNFNGSARGYGVAGLLEDLEARRPAYIALQLHDWAPDVQDSAPFFLSQPALTEFLRHDYRRVPGVEGFDVWERSDRATTPRSASR
jgi:dolichyl-phosphate-mannose-protein mannosyltransferase